MNNAVYANLKLITSFSSRHVSREGCLIKLVKDERTKHIYDFDSFLYEDYSVKNHSLEFNTDTDEFIFHNSYTDDNFSLRQSIKFEDEQNPYLDINLPVYSRDKLIKTDSTEKLMDLEYVIGHLHIFTAADDESALLQFKIGAGLL